MVSCFGWQPLLATVENNDNDLAYGKTTPITQCGLQFSVSLSTDSQRLV